MSRRLITLIALLCAFLFLLAGAAPAEGTAEAGNGAATPTDIDPVDPKPEDPDPEDPKPDDPEPVEDFVIENGVLVACNSKEENILVPAGVRVIGPNAFKKNKTVKIVFLPDSVETISAGAFAECEKLQRVILGEDSKLKEIGSKAFLNCRKLDTDFVPAGVNVAADAFQGVNPDEPTPTAKPNGGGGGGKSSGGGLPVAHAHYNGPHGPDYDQVNLKKLPDDSKKPMQQLTLGGEELALALNGGEAENGSFTVAGMDWRKEEGSPRTDTLVLTDAGGEANGKSVWTLNGEVLRKLNRSGILHLVLRRGDRIAGMETEGFLAGWNYDQLRSRGTANRRFEYTVEMEDGRPAVWRVTVGEETWELNTDDHAGIYLTKAFSGSAEALDKPYDTLQTGE